MSERQKCSVGDCKEAADYDVIFYDVYLYPISTDVFYKRHESCPFLCHKHMAENEQHAIPELPSEVVLPVTMEARRLREYRGHVRYPHARSGGEGFCIYKPLPSMSNEEREAWDVKYGIVREKEYDDD